MNNNNNINNNNNNNNNNNSIYLKHDLKVQQSRCGRVQLIKLELSNIYSVLGPVYVVTVTRDSPPPETTLPSVYMRIA